jgi:hypothetical protein
MAGARHHAMLVGVPGTVDPDPIIEQRLAALAAEYEPKLAALDDAIAMADGDTKRSLRADHRRLASAYREARRDVQRLRGPGAAW